MYRNKNVLTCLGYVLLLGVTVYTCVGCFPTTGDVNKMQDSNQDFNQGLHDAGNDLMTQQHSAMAPELHDPFADMLAEAIEKGKALAATAGETKASGDVLGGLGGGVGGIGIEWILGLFNLGWLYPFIKGFGKSRASGEVDALKNEVTALKLNLATAAKADRDIPSDSG